MQLAAGKPNALAWRRGISRTFTLLPTAWNALAVLKKAIGRKLDYGMLACVCYSSLVAQSGFALWMLSRIKSDGSFTAVEPNAAVLNVELAAAGLLLLLGMALFARQILPR